MTAPARLAIDFGTSHTVAVLDPGTGTGQPLLFGDSPLLASAVHAAEGDRLLTGRDAIRAARTAPECFEPNPKRRVDDGSILLGSKEYPVATLISAVLETVAIEARRVAGGPVGTVAITHPANWGNSRLGILRQAAEKAGLGRVQLVPEPEAAAEFFTKSQRRDALPDTVVVYDFGGGTFDVCVLTHVANEYQVRAQAGLDNVGGADLDAALIDHMGRAVSTVDADTWQRIMKPTDPDTRRAFRALYEDIKDTKEQLSRNSSALVHIPLIDRDFPVTRDEFERVAAPLIKQTIDSTTNTLSRLGISPGQPLSLYLVGGSSRVPLVSTLLHRKLGQAPVVTGQPEQVVAQGALLRLTETRSPAHVSPRREQHRIVPTASAGQASPRPPAVAAKAPSSVPPQRLSARAAAAPPPRRTGPPAAPARKSRKPVFLTILAVLVLALGAGGWYVWTKGDSATPNGSANGQAGPSGENISEEPGRAGFDECVYFESLEEHTLVSASCDDSSASHGITRQVNGKCDNAVEEEYGTFSDRDGVFCATELFEVDTCLNGYYNTTPCGNRSTAPYVIKDGPLKEDTCDAKGFKASVKLKASGKHFCLGDNDGS